jgi:hypothetical protein
MDGHAMRAECARIQAPRVRIIFQHVKNPLMEF